MTDDTTATLSALVEPMELLRRYPNILNRARLYGYLRRRSDNGLLERGVVVEQGTRLFVHEARFTEWFFDRDRAAA